MQKPFSRLVRLPEAAVTACAVSEKNGSRESCHERNCRSLCGNGNMKLTNINQVRSIMEEHQLQFNKQFGQNFLINEAIPRRIAEECGAEPDSGILEIGPGIGTLTYELAKRYRKVTAVEIDKRLIPVLADTLAEFQNVHVIQGDILKLDIPGLIAEEFGDMPVSVCANLPYYITTPILMQLLESGAPFDYITVMVQKEVADRLTSAPGDAGYGAVTASVSYYGKAQKLFGVSAGSFLPAPKVDSAVLRIRLHRTPPVSVKDKALLFRVIRSAFAQRRKTLLNSMSSEFTALQKSVLSDALQKAGCPTGVRGETLSLAEYAAIADALYDCMHA